MAKVPNTDTFSLQDVADIIEFYTLEQCIGEAVTSYYDPLYSGSTNSLYNFRNYGPPDYSVSVSQTSWYPPSTLSSIYPTVTIYPTTAVPIITDTASWITTSYNSTTHVLWIQVSRYFLGTPNRTGTVRIEHPSNSSVFCTVSISQGDEIPD